jgi:signal transduction histidine kinase
VILFGKQFVQDHLFSTANSSDLQFSIRTPEGLTLAGATLPADQVSASYSLQSARLPLQLQVWPKDSDVMFAAVRRQRNLYIGIVAIVLSLLLFGSYFTVRTLKSELAVAQMKSDFVSTVSHEFRSPLAGINQLAEMLRDKRVPDDERRMNTTK